ncbi:MAG: hypothetical protein JO243_23575 [Solirubrobacterales bacterium]|nr:hypothetical protein [Solirubrobacterales bacterium]
MLLPQAATRKAPLIEVAGIVLPLVAYLVLKQIAGNDTLALAVAEAIPCVWIVAMMARTKKFQPIPLVPLIVFGIALLITLLSGGSTLPLKLRRGFLTGGIGIACLVSLAIRRPLLEVLLPFFVRLRRIPERQARLLIDTDVGQRLLVGITALIGIVCTVDATLQVVLAFTVSTSTFLVASKIARYPLIAIGMFVGWIYARRSGIVAELRSAQQSRSTPEPPPRSTSVLSR